MSKFDPPTPQALNPNELVQAIARFGADTEGVAKAVELIQIQEALKLQDQEDFANWVAQMVQDGSDRAISALRRAGYDSQGIFQGDDLAPIDIAESLPESENRVNNRTVFLPTGLEGQFQTSAESSKSAITRMGRELADTDEALATATADVVSYFQPKSRLIDELPSLFSGVALAFLASTSLSGNAYPTSLAAGFLVGAFMAFGASRFGGGFPGIFALTAFGINGARFFRGFVASSALISVAVLIPQRVQNQTPSLIPGIDFRALLVVLLAGATVFGLLSSGRKLIWLRLTSAAAILVSITLHAVVSSSGFRLPDTQFDFLSFVAGALIGLLINAGISFATTAGRPRFHMLLLSLTSTSFVIFQMLVEVQVAPISAMLVFGALFFGVALTYASSSTTKSRFASTITGALTGLVLIYALGEMGVVGEPLLVLAVALLASWLMAIIFDSVARKGKLHLASLNRSYGFYGSMSWTSVLSILLSSLIAFSVSVFSPIASIINPVLAVAPISILLTGLFCLIRLPEIRSQEEEILAALSRSNSSNQVGIL